MAMNEEKAAAMRGRRKRLIAQGRCQDCTLPREESRNGTRCTRCARKNARDAGRRRNELIAQGRCPKCQRPRDREGIYCEACRVVIGRASRLSKLKRQARELGLAAARAEQAA